jgi:hypothetical protein
MGEWLFRWDFALPYVSHVTDKESVFFRSRPTPTPTD